MKRWEGGVSIVGENLILISEGAAPASFMLRPREKLVVSCLDYAGLVNSFMVYK